LHKLFEREGITLSRFVLGLRLERVRHVLLESGNSGDQTISAFAYSVGFNDLSTFNRAFRRRFGVTPSELRAPHRGERRPLP
jgi:AraC-like DNA-binding protein